MPFRSTDQKVWMKHNKPRLFAKWKSEHGEKIVPSKKGNQRKRDLIGPYPGKKK